MSIAEKLKKVAENQQKVYDAGKTDQWNNFWDTYQQNGERTEYQQAFRSLGWTDATFFPKYDVVAENCTQMFASSGIQDLAGRLQQAGVRLDTSRCGGFSYTFFSSDLETVPAIDTTGAPKLEYTFQSAGKLRTIEKLILKEDGTQTFTQTFTGCSNLENITIEGCIGNVVSFSSATKLTHQSLMSILTHLKDMSGTGLTQTLTLGSKNLAKLTDGEKAMATGKGWTLV